MTQLSIIIVARNEQKTIASLLHDIRRGPLAEVEIILVDGQSQDETVAVATPLVDKVLACEPGRAKQMSMGLEQSNAQWLCFLHADSRLSEAAARSLLEAISSTNRVWGRFDIRFDDQRRIFKLIAWMMNKRSCLSGIATGDQGIFVRRTVCKELGGIPKVALMEDIELSRMMKTVSRPLCLRPALLTSARRWQSKGIIKTVLLMWWLRLAWFVGVKDRVLAAWYR